MQRVFTILSSLLVLGCRDSQRASEPPSFLWRPEAITMRMDRDEQFSRLGQYLHLSQETRRNESGWTEMKLDVPETWRVSRLEMRSGEVLLLLENGNSFRVGSGNIGDLSFELLDGGEKSESDLERIWTKHASDPAGEPAAAPAAPRR